MTIMRNLIDEHGHFHRTDITSRLDEKIYPLELPKGLVDFIFRFQTGCVVECCGLDAFEFVPPSADDDRWKPNPVLENILMEEREKLDGLPAKILVSSKLNHILDKNDVIFLFYYFEAGLREARENK